jgi:hypothetical protein
VALYNRPYVPIALWWRCIATYLVSIRQLPSSACSLWTFKGNSLAGTLRPPRKSLLILRIANDIQTPPDLYNLLNEEFSPFGGDPCPLGGVEYMDGLTLDWPERTFVNPPYNIPVWIEKALQEKAKGKLVVMLIPARDKSKYWFDHI